MRKPTRKTARKTAGGGSALPGLAARLAAGELVEKVVDQQAILEVLTHETAGLAAWRALGEQDRALARAIATVALRHRGRIAAVIAHLADRPPPKRAHHLLHSLHAAAAQILFMDVPDSAAVNLGVAAVAQDKRTARFSGFANAVLRRMAREKDALGAIEAKPDQCFAPWLARQLARDHGRERLAGIAEMIAHAPVLDLTPHPRLSPAEIESLAAELGAQMLPTGSLRVVDRGEVAKLPGYGEGKWWVQDTAASLPVRLLGAVEGKEVADLCAAPGGKTMQLAGAGARVTAVDVSGARLERLRENLARTGLEAEIVETDILGWQPGRRFDAVLLDAPCSATGTMRRHPDIAWNRTPENLAALVELQRRLIEAAAALVKPGGTLVYANCSILKAEGEDTLARLMREEKSFVHKALSAQEFPGLAEWINGQGALRTMPYHLPAAPAAHGEMDGFFSCRFEVIS